MVLLYPVCLDFPSCLYNSKICVMVDSGNNASDIGFFTSTERYTRIKI